MKDKPDFKAFNEAFKARTGAWPIYPVYHMAQAFSALHAAYDKAGKAAGGKWPSREQVIDAMQGLTFQAWGRPVTLRPDDNQGIEAQLVGLTKKADGYDFMVLDEMMIFDSTKIINPANQKTGDWLKTLTPELIKLDVPVFKHGG